MKQLHRPKVPLKIYFSAFIFGLFFLLNVSAEDCAAGKRPLYFFADSSVTRHTSPVFSSIISQQLQKPLEKIGYCLIGLYNSVLADTAAQEELVMVLSMRFSVERHAVSTTNFNETPTAEVPRYDTSAQVVVSLLRVEDWSPRERIRAMKNPLLTLAYTPEELSTFTSVLIRKIVENLRTQYICHLRIQSIPQKVTIRSSSGLEGTTPLEWIIPVGKLPIAGELEGYEPIRRKIDLNTPGIHTYVLQMRKRQFYHSKFFIPTLVLGVSSAVCFGVERYYYKQYQQLGRDARENDPGAFERTYTIAKNCETAAIATIASAGVSLVLCFIF